MHDVCINKVKPSRVAPQVRPMRFIYPALVAELPPGPELLHDGICMDGMYSHHHVLELLN